MTRPALDPPRRARLARRIADLRRRRDEAVAAAHWLSCEKEDLALDRDDLRAILRPLLANPIPAPITRCVFCERRVFDDNPWGADGNGSIDPRYHTDDCPVLRAPALLGEEG